ncbi:hypothetical protein [Streptomyces sp. Isolate_219]|uniref:hypothetical protein n=1 Tax=Streptomyces sp. Isolate_219 TaxID=2950110 RepID=UPI0021C735C4|nr:hypothetical protein [Streptomyces sp. Isolate_219]MCR8576708.1 hypothetical protein [Streptomyces sp. Isolate_219]
MPEDGLEEVLRGWSSKAELYAALAETKDDWAKVKWTTQDIQQRAHRVLFAELIERLKSWPTKTGDWLNALPAGSRRDRRISPNPDQGTDWVRSAVRRGWPADEFVVNTRNRIPNQVMASTLRWTIDEIIRIRTDALRVEATLRNEVKQQIKVLSSIESLPPLNSSAGVRPTRQDIKALRMEGAPWTQLAQVAELLVDAETSNLMDFARKHLLPDPGVRWRLFHLGSLGVLLKRLYIAEWELTSWRPLSGTTEGGPNYTAHAPDGGKWDIWFEASKIWEYYKVASPYLDLMEDVFASSAEPVGADLAIIRPGVAGYLFECKFGDAAEVRRKGYHQITTYVAEALRELVPRAEGFVIGPDDVVLKSAVLKLQGAPIHIVGPRHLDSFLPETD